MRERDQATPTREMSTNERVLAWEAAKYRATEEGQQRASWEGVRSTHYVGSYACPAFIKGSDQMDHSDVTGFRGNCLYGTGIYAVVSHSLGVPFYHPSSFLACPSMLLPQMPSSPQVQHGTHVTAGLFVSQDLVLVKCALSISGG